MYQSKLHTEHNKNLLASVCLGMLWLLCARVWKVGVCVCVSGCVHVCVVPLCKSANTPRCQLADIKARESFFIVMSPCWGVELDICIEHGWQQRKAGGRGWCCAHCKAACMTACVAYNYKSRGKKGNICYPKQNGCTTILADFQLRAFVPFPLPPFPLGAFAWIIIFAFLMRSHRESFKHFVHWNIYFKSQNANEAHMSRTKGDGAPR